MRISERSPFHRACYCNGGGAPAPSRRNIYDLKKEFLARINRPPRPDEFADHFLFRIASDLYLAGKRGFAALGTVFQLPFYFSESQEATLYDKTNCLLDNTCGRNPPHLTALSQDGLPISMEFQRGLLYKGAEFIFLPDGLKEAYAQQTFKREPGKIYMSSANIGYYCYALDHALILQKKGNTDEALLWIKAAILINPTVHYAFTYAAEIYGEIKDFSSKAEIFSQLIRLFPKHPLLYCERGLCRQVLKQFDSAMQDIDTALAIDPGFSLAIFTKGTLLMELKRYAEAEPYYLQVVDSKLPDDLKELVFRNLGAGLIFQNRPKEAIWRLEQGLEAFPNSMEILQNLAVAHFYCGNIPRALENIERTLGLEPENHPLILLRASFLLQLGREKEALAFARRKLVPPETPDEAILAFIQGNAGPDGMMQ